jgi:hypothetical protein
MPTVIEVPKVNGSSGGGGSLPDPVTIAHGGTGQTTANAALNALQALTLAQNSTLALLDNGTNSSAVIRVDKHTSSGTSAPGFGVSSVVDLQSAAGNLRRVAQYNTFLQVATDAAEEAGCVFSFMQGGTLRSCVSLGYAINSNIPLLSFGGSGNGLIYNAGTLATWLSSTQSMQWTSTQITSAVRHLMTSARFETCKGADVASANTLTLGTDGNVFGITGTTTINGITTANWQAGSRLTLILQNGITVTNASGTPGAGAVAIILRAAANLTTSKVYLLDLIYDGTNWRQPD